MTTFTISTYGEGVTKIFAECPVAQKSKVVTYGKKYTSKKDLGQDLSL